MANITSNKGAAKQSQAIAKQGGDIETALDVQNFAELAEQVKAAMTIPLSDMEELTGGSFIQFSKYPDGHTEAFHASLGECQKYGAPEGTMTPCGFLVDINGDEKASVDVVLLSTLNKLDERSELPCIITIHKKGMRTSKAGEYADLQIFKA